MEISTLSFERAQASKILPLVWASTWYATLSLLMTKSKHFFFNLRSAFFSHALAQALSLSTEDGNSNNDKGPIMGNKYVDDLEV